MFQCYRAFTSKLFQLGMFIVYPLLAMVGCILVQGMKGYHFFVSGAIMCDCMIFVECLADYLVFSGIQTKSAKHMDFIKSSKRGKEFFYNSLIADLIRRGVTIFICNGINALLGIVIFKNSLGGMEGVYIIAMYGLCSYFFSTLGTFISRFFDSWWMNFGIAYGGSFISSILFWLNMKLGLANVFWAIIYLTVSILITLISVRVAMKKVEDSYYD